MAKGVRKTGAAKSGGRKGGKSVKDYQRGNAANDYDVDVDGEGEDLANARFEPETRALQNYLDLIDEQDKIISDIMTAARKKCQGARNAMKTGRKRMIEDGYHAKPLDTKVRKHRLERKAASVTDNLDAEEIEFFEALEKALGGKAGLVGTPLGDGALKESVATSVLGVDADADEDEFA